MCRSHASISLGGHSFSHGMNTHEPSIKPHFIDGYYDSFSCGLGCSHGHALKASCVGPQHHSHGASNGFSRVFPSRGSRRFAMDHCTRSSFWVAISQHTSKGDSSPSHLNQRLHHVNSHDKLSTLICQSHRFPSIYLLTLQGPRLEHLSLFSYVGPWTRDGGHELNGSQSFA